MEEFGVEEINSIAQVFLETTKRLTGKEVIVYSDLSNAQDTFGREIADNYQLWLAYYGDYNELTNISASWETWIGVQYTDRGRIAGINGSVDRDIYTKEIFLDDNSEIPATETPNEEPINTQTVYYTVQRGDTLYSIAARYGTTLQEIASINNITNPNLIYPGQTLRILSNSIVNGFETRGTGTITYTVRRGNTLSQIARAYGVSVAHLQELNDIQNPNLIYPGQKIRITESTVSSLNPMPQSNYYTYTVQRGDSLWRIARRFRVSVRYLVRINNIQNPNLIYPGQVLKI